ncbi:hypothetical protein [Xanthobacter versatilis]|uniref:hypothetical protein n=1 Tax=Xanthobacter autotrophicus (strain ATCC BAA-1158 / Py2) TaxID=78245 RepID=UPI00372C5C4F
MRDLTQHDGRCRTCGRPLGEDQHEVDGVPGVFHLECLSEKDSVLWCAHIRGPDDVVACVDYGAAVNLCDEINAVAMTVAHLDVLCIAYPAAWPWAASEHAADLARGNEYRGAVSTIATKQEA